MTLESPSNADSPLLDAFAPCPTHPVWVTSAAVMGPPALQTSTELEKGPVFMVAHFLFFLLAILAIAAAFGLFLSMNQLVSYLWLVLLLFFIAVLYLYKLSQFFGIFLFICYVIF